MNTALLRTCASCKWIFKLPDKNTHIDCPKCGFGHYSARYVFGNTAYRYQRTQKPWYDQKMFDYSMQLLEEINGNKND